MPARQCLMCRRGVAQNTIYRWKAKFGGMEVSAAKRLGKLEGENAKLKRLLAEAERDQGCAKGARAGKMVTAAQRRALALLTMSRLSFARRACRLVELSRSVAQYRRLGRNDAVLRTRLRALAEAYPRYGYPTLHEMLKTEGLVINRKRTYRLYREERLQERTRRRKKLARARTPMLVPSAVNER